MRALAMSTKLNKRQFLAAEMLGIGHRPSAVAEKLAVTRETVSRWQKSPKFEEIVTQSCINNLSAITTESALIISKANNAIIEAFDNADSSACAKASIAIRYLACVGHQNNVYQKLKERMDRLQRAESQDMTPFQWVADILDCIAELKASRGHISDAEYRERIDALFAKTRGGNTPSAKTEFIP